ncbi:MAG: hypothetical protein OEW79_01555 [Betaproteobacteria bacterium]|nr:hypothetical protein [Betaproteobacteria bacterium]MDH5341499.1 hypothetical protein [Betaproteobacteria bacterium]
MTNNTERSAGKGASGGCACAVAGVVLLSAMAAQAQTLKIPDFRNERPAAAVSKPGEKCDQCGVIRTIREIQSRREQPVPQAFQNNPATQGPGGEIYVGAVAAMPMGPGESYVGAVGTPEMRNRFTSSSYEITVKLDAGGYTVLQRADGGHYQVGDRVRVRGIQLERLAP